MKYKRTERTQLTVKSRKNGTNQRADMGKTSRDKETDKRELR